MSATTAQSPADAHRRSFFDLQRGIDPPLAPAFWPSGVWVARRDGRPVGWAAGRVFGDGRGWVDQLAVAGRGLGLGRALLLHSLAALRERGATSLALGVQGENENAIGMYRNVGFEVEREWARLHEARRPRTYARLVAYAWRRSANSRGRLSVT